MLKAVVSLRFPLASTLATRSMCALTGRHATVQSLHHRDQVSDETRTPTVIEHAKFGRLLIFDPTDAETPVGDLPFYLQGSLALIDSKIRRRW